jgi:hypothetical protein
MQMGLAIQLRPTSSGGGSGKIGLNGKNPEKEIKDAIGDVAIAQSIIDLANKEGTNLDDIVALLEKTIDVYQITQWLQDGINLDGVATLLDQRIDSPVVTQLIDNQADLRDIAINAQILLNGDVRVDLVNGWLKNGTHLNDAIAIMCEGVDLNQIGTSSNVGDFTGLTGATPNEIVSRIPADAKIEHWLSEPGKIEKGMVFKWKDASRKIWLVRMHEADPNPKLPAWSNAARGWVLRVRHSGKYMDAAGYFYTQNALTNPDSTKYDPNGANATHMPIQAPSGR